MSELQHLLDDAVLELGTQQAVATALGISTSRLGRVRKGEYSLDVLTCLKLAQAVRLPPSHVLTAAGKGELATLIEKLYGKAPAGLDPQERALLDAFAHVPDTARQAALTMLQELAGRTGRKRRSA